MSTTEHHYQRVPAQGSKRKYHHTQHPSQPSHHNDHQQQCRKKVNMGLTHATQAADTVRATHAAILNTMQGSYQTELLSVISSSSINSKVESMMRHLSRFHPTDLSILPGVVLIHARAKQAQKLFTMVEITKRRVHEMDQKWYQYNQLHQVNVEVRPEDISQAERGGQKYAGDNAAAPMEIDDSDDSDDAFEPLPQDQQQPRIMHPNNTQELELVISQHLQQQRPHLFVSVFLSRVPIEEFEGKAGYTMQTNAEHIDAERRKRWNIVDPMDQQGRTLA